MLYTHTFQKQPLEVLHKKTVHKNFALFNYSQENTCVGVSQKETPVQVFSYD